MRARLGSLQAQRIGLGSQRPSRLLRRRHRHRTSDPAAWSARITSGAGIPKVKLDDGRRRGEDHFELGPVVVVIPGRWIQRRPEGIGLGSERGHVGGHRARVASRLAGHEEVDPERLDTGSAHRGHLSARAGPLL